MLWDHDSGLMLPETIEYLRGLDVHLDFVSLDCNLARGQNISPYHMDILQANETAQMLRQMGRADERTRFSSAILAICWIARTRSCARRPRSLALR